MNQRSIERAHSLARDVSHALTALYCRGHIVAVPGCEAPDFREARRFVEVSVWMLWRVPHVMLVPCVAAGEVPAVLLGTWDARGVAIRQTVTSREDFVAAVTRAAETLAARHSRDDLAMMEALHRDGVEVPELENVEFWPEVLASVREREEEPIDPGSAVVETIAAALWQTRIADLRERQRALED